MKDNVGDQYTILYFADYGKNFGGAANALLQQAVLMKQAGYRAIIFFSDYFGKAMSSEYKEVCSSIGIEYEWASYQISNQTEDIDVVCIDKNYEEFRNRIKTYHPDILHSVQINASVELISRELDIPHIMNIYPLIPDFFSLNYLNVFPHYHICDSWYYAKMWRKYLHTESTCIRTVVNKRQNGGKELNTTFINYICVGAVYREKNQLAVIKAFHKALINGIRAKLTICGYIEGDYGRECVQYVESNHLEGSIILKGFCTDMDKEYQHSDVLICGSTRESYPNAISEALANGLVVISTPVGGIPEVIKDGENGYLTQNCLEDALLEKILQVQKDAVSGKIEAIMAMAEKTFLAQHSPQTVTKQLLQYYQYVVKDKQKVKKQIGINNIIKIENVRNCFKPMLDLFEKSKAKFTNEQEVSAKLWYLYHIKGRISRLSMEGRKIYIWGIGNYGVIVKEIMETFLPQIHIEGFLDSNKKGAFEGYAVYHPEEVLQKDSVVVIAARNGQNEMIKRLESDNFVFNKDFFILAKRNW